MIVGQCRGCGGDVFEADVGMALEIIKVQQNQGFSFVHGWWSISLRKWMDCTKKRIGRR